MSLQSPLARVRGLGSAKEGVGHWWRQRVTAIALVPLTLWFAVSLLGLVGAGYSEMVAWVSSPLVAGLLILLLLATFYHAALGLQVVIEDYVHHEPAKLVLLLASHGLMILLGLISLLSVLTLLFRG